MNRKRFYRNQYCSHTFPTLLNNTTAIIAAATIVLVVLSSTVYSRVYLPPHKLSSCATVVPRQTAAVSQHFRSTKKHIIVATDSECNRFTTMMHNRRRRYVVRLIGETVTVGQTVNNTSNHTRCYKIKFTTPMPTTKRWSPLLKTYPNFPVMNNTVTKVTTTKISKITKASTTTEATTEPPEETQEIEGTTTTEATISSDETTCTEETAFAEENSSSEETTCLEEETTLTEETTPTKNTKKTINESIKTEKASKTTVRSTEKTSKTTGKSSKTTEKFSKSTKKITKTTEEYDEVVTCSEDPSCDEEPSCLDNEVTSKPTKAKPSPVKKSSGVIKPKNRSKLRRLDRRRQPSTTTHRRWSSSLSSSSSSTIALDDSLWSDNGLNYESP